MNDTVRVVFLDIDGVMHPLFPLPDRCHAENQLWSSLERFMAELPSDVIVVLASDWRKRPGAMDNIPAQLKGRLAGCTPVINAHYDGVREDEALLWIHQNFAGYDVEWMALDDNQYLYRSFEKVLVCHDGFRDREIDLWRSRDQYFSAPVRETFTRR